jgi:hypothetical protein
MRKRSSFNNPRWQSKEDKNNKMHKMGIDYFIDLKMIELLIYDNTYHDMDRSGFEVKINSKGEDLLTVSDIEEAIRRTLQWEGLNFWESMEYKELDNDKLEYAKEFTRKKFPRWVQANARHFIGDST